jgi:hypothetical protein
MATWSTQGPQPAGQNARLITDVAAGDQIDIQAILGRPARRLTISTGDAADIVSYRLNNLRRVPQVSNDNRAFAPNAASGPGPDTTTFWSKATDLWTDVGLIITTMEGFAVSSIEIDSLTLATGTTVTITVY